jgi:Erv1 / Alr family
MTSTTVWGPHLWAFIHCICKFNFEDNERFVLQTIENLKSLAGAIPCHKCRHIYEKYIEELDSLDKKEPYVLYKWSVRLHNEVNKKLGKPVFTE